MAKYRLVMTPAPCRMAGCIIPIKPTYSCACVLTYLLTYFLHNCLGRIKPAEDRAKVAINGLYKVVHGLSTAAKNV